VRPVLAISVGCPSGIGPEVAVAAAARTRDAACLLVCDERIARRAAAIVRVPARRLVRVEDARAARALAPGAVGVWAGAAPIAPEDAPPGAPTRAAGAAQLAWIDEALRLVRTKAAAAIVTGPVSKHAIASSGAGAAARRFRGHTEHLAASLRAREVVMAFWSEELTTALVTTHLPLAKVPRAITPRAVGAAAFRVAELAAKLRGRAVRVAVASLNPHAGEGGLLGDEETTRIRPGIAVARRRIARARWGAELVGPLGAESALRLARGGAYDAVVCMYHDQATIPMKLLGFGEAVNVTLGLPVVRTSVDHGTGYDRAGQGTADPRGMRAALELAGRLVR
jgi:4-hydroxythreonine-4-phosphate dehydrogenase